MIELTATSPEAKDKARLTLARAGFASDGKGGWVMQRRHNCKECGKSLPPTRPKYCSDKCGYRYRGPRNRLHRKKYALREEMGLTPASAKIRARHLAMIAMRATGATYREIGERFGVGLQQAFSCCNYSTTARNTRKLVRVAVMVEPEEYDRWRRAAGSRPLAEFIRENIRAVV